MEALPEFAEFRRSIKEYEEFMHSNGIKTSKRMVETGVGQLWLPEDADSISKLSADDLIHRNRLVDAVNAAQAALVKRATSDGEIGRKAIKVASHLVEIREDAVRKRGNMRSLLPSKSKIEVEKIERVVSAFGDLMLAMPNATLRTLGDEMKKMKDDAVKGGARRVYRTDIAGLEELFKWHVPQCGRIEVSRRIANLMTSFDDIKPFSEEQVAAPSLKQVGMYMGKPVLVDENASDGGADFKVLFDEKMVDLTEFGFRDLLVGKNMDFENSKPSTKSPSFSVFILESGPTEKWVCMSKDGREAYAEVAIDAMFEWYRKFEPETLEVGNSVGEKK